MTRINAITSQLLDQNFEVIQAWIQHCDAHTRQIQRAKWDAPTSPVVISFRDFQAQWEAALDRIG